MLNLLDMARDPRFTFEVQLVVRSPVDFARNCAVKLARERKADWLLMVDNDQSFYNNPLEIPLIAEPQQISIVGISTVMLIDAGFSGNFQEPPVRQWDATRELFKVDWIGTGAMFVSHRVWESVAGPWFRWETGDDELLTPRLSEDQVFCKCMREKGFQTWADSKPMSHHKTVDLTQVIAMQQQQRGER